MNAGPDTSRLSPADCVAALRSFPRRASEAVAPAADGEDVDVLARVAEPGGHSAIGHLDGAARSIDLLAEAVRSVLVQNNPMLPAGVLDDRARTGTLTGGAERLAGVVTRFATTSRAAADLAEGEAGGADGWDRTGTITGTAAGISALDLLREAVRSGAAAVRGAETAMDAARR